MARTERMNVRSREDVSEMPDWLKAKRCPHKKQYLSGKRIMPKNLTGREKLSEVVDETFLAYNSARLKECCQLFAERMLAADVTIGMSISGALTPAGLGCSCLIPLIKAGFVDWIVSTGANLYHDMHFALNFPVHAGSFKFDDTDLRDNDIVRIYDVLIPYSDGLMTTDELLRTLLMGPEFQKEMGTGELHYLLGRYCAEWERNNKLKDVSVLAAAYYAGVPCYTSSPGDSTIGMNVAGVELRGNKLRLNPAIDVNETTAFVLAAKRSGGRSGVVLWGGGSPKNFMLQTEPQIQEILRIKEFLPPDHRCAAGYWRALRGDAERSRKLGQSGPNQAPGCGRLLHRQHDCDAAHDPLCPRETQATQAPPALRPARTDDESADERVLRSQ